MKKSTIVTVVIALAALVAVLVGLFYYLISRPAQAENDVEATEVEELIALNIEGDYPASPRGVVNLYSRYLTALYNEEYSEEQFGELITKMRIMFDEDLLTNNPEDEYYASMQSDVNEYKQKQWTIRNYTIPDTDEVTYKEIDKRKCALLTVSYFIKQGTSFAKSFQNYVLRKDDDGKWKIYGYSLKQSETVDENGNEIEE
ncbi:MAG: hypothetical protein K5840_06760 [Eubacterium sp.]|nr:hypothetical protein [Eubacterium sp.]